MRQLVEQHLANLIPTNRLLNVNIPDRPLELIQGIEVTRLGARHHAESMIKQKDPRGHDIYWLGPPGKSKMPVRERILMRLNVVGCHHAATS